ncbi:MAG: T9SS type A sorting domain-containing protein [Candidatus Aegiribacteria sp.]|nr:T9SS type A sorting domain-containing protein [Candidatus Aegiribacteria sp.]
MRLFLFSLLMIFPALLLAQSMHQVDTDLTSEWEATGFNNGRAMVRDADGYFHIVYHTQDNPDSSPGGPCDIWYSHTLIPAPPTISADWAPAVKIVNLPGDDRYPSIAIEHGSAGVSNDNDMLHVVWQHNEGEPGSVYDIFYCSSPNALVPPPDAWRLASPLHVSAHNSLVPDIDCSLGNILHVVWQEEDVDPFSEIYYSQSPDHGGSWSPFTNISMTLEANSQMPDVATIIDFPEAPSEYTYCSEVVHVVWNDDYDTSSPPHILYTFSPDAGISWMPFEDVTFISGAYGSDGYPTLTVDRDDIPHVAWMTYLLPSDPDNPGPYTPGVDPAVVNSFPGPDPGMYGVYLNYILYSWRLGAVWSPFETVSGVIGDEEFPSIAVDQYNNLYVAYQNMLVSGDYDIYQATKVIGGFPWVPACISNDPDHDDFFPSEATKKAGTSSPGFDLTWTKIDSDGSAGGHGSLAARSSAHEIWFSGNTSYAPPVAIGDSPDGIQVQGLSVYPNPVLAGAWIFTGESSGLVKIFDLSGRVVFRESIMPNSNGNCFWGAVGSDGTPLPNGQYIVTLQNGELLETRSIIVAR